MSSSKQSLEAPSPIQSAISDLAKQISHLAVAQADSGVQSSYHMYRAKLHLLYSCDNFRKCIFFPSLRIRDVLCIIVVGGPSLDIRPLKSFF